MIRFPITLMENEAKSIGNIILKNAAIEDKVIKFIIDSNAFSLRPTDLVTLKCFNKKYSIRIIDTQINKNKMIVTGIVDNIYSYLNAQNSRTQSNLRANANIENALVILDLPIALQNMQSPFVAAYLRHSSSAILSARLSTDNNYSRISTLMPSSSMGEVVEFTQSPNATIFMIDNVSTLLIRGYNLEQYASTDWQFAMIGEELVQFKNLTKLEEQLYKVTNLIRGENGTEDYIDTHAEGEDFVIIYSGINIVPVLESLENQTMFFKAADIEKAITYKNRAAAPIKQYLTRNEIFENKLYLNWVTRIRALEDWSNAGHTENIEFTILITDNHQIHQYQTGDNSIIIDINELSLSANYKVTILANIHSTQRV